MARRPSVLVRVIRLYGNKALIECGQDEPKLSLVPKGNLHD